MSNGSSALALALGAGAGLGLWYLLRDDDEKKQDAAPTTPTTTSTAPTTASGATAAPTSSPAVMTAPPPSGAACALRLDAIGLTADGVPIDIPGAVARCKPAGRVDLTFAKSGPAQVYMDLNTALSKAGIKVTVLAA